MVYYPFAVTLPEGGYRLFYYGSFLREGTWSGGILSALSPDGLVWRGEKGWRLLPGTTLDARHCQAPCMVALEPRCYRLYYTGIGDDGTGRILSALSRDMLTWVREERILLDPEWIEGCTGVSDPAAVMLEGGAMRLYFTASFGHRQRILSAFSGDWLNFRLEEGARIGTGSPGCSLVVNNPSIVREGERYAMYFRGGDMMALYNSIYHACSKDGLRWKIEGPALMYSRSHRYERHAVAFPMVLKTREGFWRMYYTGYWGRCRGEKRLVRRWMKVNREAMEGEPV